MSITKEELIEILKASEARLGAKIEAKMDASEARIKAKLETLKKEIKEDTNILMEYLRTKKKLETTL